MFDWREYLELAKALSGQASSGYSSEAAQRTAVSRAYYAAFCIARNYAMARLGFKAKGRAQDHHELRECLKQYGKPQLASHLNRLRQWRNDCDYENMVPNLFQCVKSAIDIANKVVQECR